MGSRPNVIEQVLAVLAMLFKLLVDLGCLSGLVENLARRGWPGCILVWRASHFMSWSLNTAVIPRLHVGRCALVVRFGARCRYATGCGIEPAKRLQGVHSCPHIVLIVASIGIWMSKSHGVGVSVVGLCGSCFPGLGGAWPLLPSRVFLGEALLPRLALPVVVAYPAAVGDEPASKLSEHGPCGYNGNLPRPVRVGQDFLVDQIILLCLGGDDLEQGSVLVEEQIRVTVAEDARTFGREHEQLVASVWHKEGPAAILSSFQRMASLRHLSLSCLVNLAGYEFITLWVELVGGVVADGGKGLDYGRFGGCGLGRGRCVKGRAPGQGRRLELRSLHWGRDAAVRRRGRRLGAAGRRGSKRLLWRATTLFPLVDVVIVAMLCISIVILGRATAL